MTKKKFNYRGFTSFTMVFSFIIMTVTGLVLYVTPPGRIAHWMDWEFLFLSKEGWQTAHTVFSFLFVVAGLYHLLDFNWKIFKSYIASNEGKGVRLKRELLVSLALTMLFLAGSVAGLPPFQTVMTAGESLREMWYSKQDEPPIPHAETMTLKEVSERLGLDPEDTVERLRELGMSVKHMNQRLSGIAKKNKISARELFTRLSGRN